MNKSNRNFPVPPSPGSSEGTRNVPAMATQAASSGLGGYGSLVGQGKGLDPDVMSYILRTTLTPKHRDNPEILAFIMSYLECRDVKQASRVAGVLPATGHAIRNRKDVNEAIVTLTDQAVMKHGYDASELIEKVKEVVYIDPLEFENPDGSFKTHMREISPEARRAIKKFKVKNLYDTDPNGMRVVSGQIIDIELYDKMKGVELLGREKNIFKETTVVEHDVTGNMKEVLLESKRMADERVAELREREDKRTIDVTPIIKQDTPP